MRYVLSGLVGFFATLVISLPMQHLMQIKEARASGISARAKSLVVPQLNKGSVRQRGEYVIDIASLHGISVDSKEPRIKFLPQYPIEAAKQKLEGYVTLSFTVGNDGSVQNLKVIDSYPLAIFDDAARRAVGRWNFRPSLANKDPNLKSESSEQRLRLNFNLKKALAVEDMPMSSL